MLYARLRLAARGLPMLYGRLRLAAGGLPMIAWAPYPRSAACGHGRDGPRSAVALFSSGVEKTRSDQAQSLTNSLAQPRPGGGRSRLRGGPILGGAPGAATDTAPAAAWNPKKAARALAGCRRTSGGPAGGGGAGDARAGGQLGLRPPAAPRRRRYGTQ